MTVQFGKPTSKLRSKPSNVATLTFENETLVCGFKISESLTFRDSPSLV